MTIADLLSPADVIMLSSPQKLGVLRAMARHAAESHRIDGTAVARALIDREAMGSTGVGKGVALPHARLADLRRPFGVFAMLTKPVEFGAVDDQPVDLVFLLLLPAHQPEQHVRCLAGVARRFREPGVADTLRRSMEPAKAFSLLVSG